MPTRIPLVNGIFSSPAVADGLQADRRVLGRRALVGDQVRVRRLEHQPLGGRDLAQPREVVAVEHAEVGVRQEAALQPALARPHDVGDEVLEAERLERGCTAGASPVSTSSSFTPRRAARSIRRSTSSG